MPVQLILLLVVEQLTYLVQQLVLVLLQLLLPEMQPQIQSH
jgi:hypothetical protein